MKKTEKRAFLTLFGINALNWIGIYLYRLNGIKPKFKADLNLPLLVGFAVTSAVIYLGVRLADKLGVKFKYLIGKTGDMVNDLVVPGVLVGGASALLFKLTNLLTPFALNEQTRIYPYNLVKQTASWSFLDKFVLSSTSWLFGFLVIVFILAKIFTKKSREECFKLGVIVTALLGVIGFFNMLGVGFSLIPVTVVLLRGLTFGYLFWKKGFESVMAAELIELAVRLFV